jgi:ketosteroid isomerase-like protein
MLRSAGVWGFAIATIVLPMRASAQTPAQTPVSAQQSEMARDGSHDFDFEFGTWNTHIRRLLHPLTGSTTWVDYYGTTVVRKIWNGKAHMAEVEVDGPGGHIEALSLRLYNPQSHQWSLNFATSAGGSMSVPTVGEFRNGRGELYDYEAIDGKMILVRNLWSDITPTSARFEQSFSSDGGKSWEANWIGIDTRVKDAEASELPADLAKAVKALDDATVHGDVPALTRLVSDDFVLVNSDASVENKTQYLADFGLPGFKIDPYVREQPVEKMSGDDAAVIAGLVHLSWTQDGKHQTRTLRTAYMWAKRGGRWQATYAQVTRVP